MSEPRALQVGRALHLAAGMLEGGLAGDYISDYFDSPPHSVAAKWVFEGMHVLGTLDDLMASIPEVSDQPGADRLAVLKTSAREARACAGAIDDLHNPTRYDDRSQVDRFWGLVSRAADLVDAIRTDVEVALLARRNSQRVMAMNATFTWIIRFVPRSLRLDQRVTVSQRKKIALTRHRTPSMFLLVVAPTNIGVPVQ